MTPGPRSRRAFLRRGGALALSAGLAGCQFRDRTDAETETERQPDTATPETPTHREHLATTYGDQFDEYVDIVDAGADPDGSEPIDPVLDRVVADDTLVYLPPGDYRVRSFRVDGVANAGVVGESSAETNIVPARPAVDIDHDFLRFLSVEEFLLGGFTLEYGEPGHGGATHVISRGDFTVRDVRVAGVMPDETLPDNPAALRFDVREESASATVENVVATDGGHDGGNAVGLYVGKDHAGTIEFVDCEVAGFPNNGLYASAPGRDDADYHGRDGTVHVRGGRYENNNIANVRLGSTDSTARDVTIVVDERPPTHAGALNVRGLRVRNRSGQVIENCEIVLGADAAEGFGGLVFHPNAGSVTVRDTTVRVDRDGTYAVRALGGDPQSRAPGLTFENVTLSGSADGGWSLAVTGREGVTVRDCSVSGTGADRNGLSFTNCGDCVVDGGEIDVPGDPIRERGTTLETRDLSTGAATE